MNDFIAIAVSRFGLPMSTVRDLAGSTLALIFRETAPRDADAIRRSVPATEQMMRMAATRASTRSPARPASNPYGRGAEPGRALMKQFSDAGLDPARSAGFIRMLIDYLSRRAGADVVSRVVSQTPALLKIIG